jgi:hypothetical protein
LKIFENTSRKHTFRPVCATGLLPEAGMVLT